MSRWIGRKLRAVTERGREVGSADLCVEIEEYRGLLLCHLGDVLIILLNQHY